MVVMEVEIMMMVVLMGIMMDDRYRWGKRGRDIINDNNIGIEF